VDGIFREYARVGPFQCDIRSHEAGVYRPAAAVIQYSPATATATISCRLRPGRVNSGDGDCQDSDDGENDRQKSPSNIPKDSQGNCLLFACPYVKRYPHRYRECYGHTLKDVARVKYHLFRNKYSLAKLERGLQNPFSRRSLPSSPYINMSLSETLHAFREHELSEGPPI
jgi:hypothetical protein